MEGNSTDKNFAVISLGSNIGDRLKNIKKTIKHIKNIPETKISDISSIYETDPVDTLESFKFLNCVIVIKTNLTPMKLLLNLLDIEEKMGRVRTHKNSPREIDLDILFYEDLILESKHLKIPHPRLHSRKFVLEPLCEILPDIIHPILNVKARELLSKCENKKGVKKFISRDRLYSYIK